MATAFKLDRSPEAIEIAALVARSRAAQEAISEYTQAQVELEGGGHGDLLLG